MSLLFIYLVERDFSAFKAEYQRDPETFDDCYAKARSMRDIGLMHRLDDYMAEIIGQPAPITNFLIQKVKAAIAIQFPNAKPGDVVTLDLDGFHPEVTIGRNGSFGQTVEQAARSIGISTAEVEKFLFKNQIETIGNNPRSAQYLDRSTVFVHSLAQFKQEGEQCFANDYGAASYLIETAYLDVEGGDGIQTRIEIANLLGRALDSEVERLLFDRHLPTIYQVCSRIVEKLELQRGQK